MDLDYLGLYCLKSGCGNGTLNPILNSQVPQPTCFWQLGNLTTVLGRQKKSCSQVCRAPCLPLRPSQISHRDLVLSCKYHLPDLLLRNRLLLLIIIIIILHLLLLLHLIITCVCLVSPNVIFFSILWWNKRKADEACYGQVYKAI